MPPYIADHVQPMLPGGTDAHKSPCRTSPQKVNRNQRNSSHFGRGEQTSVYGAAEQADDDGPRQ